MPDDTDELRIVDPHVHVLDGNERTCVGWKYLRQPRQLERNDDAHNPAFSTATGENAGGGSSGLRWSRERDACRWSERHSTTWALARIACSSCASWSTLRGFANSTPTDEPSVARGPFVIGMMRSDNSKASSILFVIITVVTGRPASEQRPASSC